MRQQHHVRKIKQRLCDVRLIGIDIKASTGDMARCQQIGKRVLVDNLATAHLAPPETQKPASEIGLRVLHRVVVAGTAALAPFVTSESS